MYTPVKEIISHYKLYNKRFYGNNQTNHENILHIERFYGVHMPLFPAVRKSFSAFRRAGNDESVSRNLSKTFTCNRIVEHQEGGDLFTPSLFVPVTVNKWGLNFQRGMRKKNLMLVFFDCSCFAEMSCASFACVSLVIG